MSIDFIPTMYIVVWLQKESARMIASLVEAMYPDEAISKVVRYHTAIDKEAGPTGTVFIAQASQARDGSGRMLSPWICQEVTVVESRPVFVYDEYFNKDMDAEVRETFEALENLVYEQEIWSIDEDPWNRNPGKINWDRQTRRDEEAEAKYGSYLNNEDEYWYWIDDDYDWLENEVTKSDYSTPPTNEGCYDESPSTQIDWNDYIWDPIARKATRIEDYKIGGTD